MKRTNLIYALAAVAALIIGAFGLRSMWSFKSDTVDFGTFTREAGAKAPELPSFTRDDFDLIHKQGQGFYFKCIVKADPRKDGEDDSREVNLDPAPSSTFNRPARKNRAVEMEKSYAEAKNWCEGKLTYEHNFVTLVDTTEGEGTELAKLANHSINDLADGSDHLKNGDTVNIHLAIVSNESTWLARRGDSTEPIILKGSSDGKKVTETLTSLAGKVKPNSAIASNLASALSETKKLKNRTVIIISDGLENDPTTVDCYTAKSVFTKDQRTETITQLPTSGFPTGAKPLEGVKIIWVLTPTSRTDMKTVQTEAKETWLELLTNLGANITFEK